MSKETTPLVAWLIETFRACESTLQEDPSKAFYDLGLERRAANITFMHAIEVAEAECQKVEGRTTKYYRGDTMTANELLDVLKRYAGLTKEPTNEEG